jgi:predicted RNA-binding protein
MGYLRQSITAVIALASVVLLIPFVDAQTGTIVPTWQAGGATEAIAVGPAAAVLDDGRILIAGYTPTTGRASATVAIYNPATGVWTSPGNLLQSRTGHTATTLTDGRVLIAGGKIALPGGTFNLTGSLELFDSSTGTSTAVIGAGLAIPRRGHAAVRLQDGRVLFVGGANNLGALDIAEIYDPSTNTMSQTTGQMSAKRSNPSATRLPDGRVLVAGGRNDAGVDLATAEIFDPTSQEFLAASTMAAARSSHAAVLLPFNNNVLVFGGSSNGTSLSSAELYDSGTDTWTTTASMAAPRVGGFAAATADGGAAAIGGGPASAEFYRFVSMSSGSSGGTGGTGGTSTGGGAITPPTDPASTAQLLDFPATGHPSLPGGGTFGYPFIELTNSVVDHVHQNELFGATTYDGSTQTLTMKMYPQWITFASAPIWFQAGSLAQSTDENLSISPCNQPGTFTDINHNGVRDFWEDTNGNGVLDAGEDVNGDGILDLEPPIECGRFEIHAQLDSQGHLVGLGTDTDVLMRGHIIKEHFDSTLNHFVTDVDVNGTLLTGKVVEFGFQNPSTDAVLSSYCLFGASEEADGLCHAADGSTSQPLCQAGFSPAPDGSCHSPGARFTLRVAITGGLLVNPTSGPASLCVQPSCFIANPIDVLDPNSDLGIDIKSANISGSLASGALSGYASGTAGPIPKVAGLAPSTTTVTFQATPPYLYRGTPFTATAVATDSHGTVLATDPTVQVVYTGDCLNVSPAGCTATATFHGDATHAESTASQTITIAPRPITFRADDITRTYGETTPAFGYSVTAGTIVAGDTFGTPIFTPDGLSAGSHSIALSGLSNPNYTITFANGTLTVTPRELTITALGSDKVYDGTTGATVTLGDNRLPFDTFTTSYLTASFDDKNVGTGKTVKVTGITISGDDAGNYTFNTTTETTADITRRSLTVTATGVNKEYDGNATATVTLHDDRVAGDVLTTTYTAAFADKNVGDGKAVTVTGVNIGGSDARNYTANTTASTTADITKRPLTVTATGVNKVYDGTTAATVALSDNRITGDVVTVTYTAAAFANKSIGLDKAVAVSGIGISGRDAGNYTVNTTASTTASITPRQLTVTATGVDKVYDRTTTAAVTLSTDALPGDLVTANYGSATFDSVNIGLRNVTVTGITIGGVDGGNYTPNGTASTKANITARPLTVTASGVNKAYDGMATATVSLSDDRIAGDGITASYGAATFADENAGVGKTVSVTGIALGGTGATNYVLSNTTASATANITKTPLTVSATAANKVYDGNTTATVTLTDNRISGDLVTLTYTTATFADENVGTAKAVTVSGIGISGGDAGNYSANATASTTANITRRQLTVTATGVNKVYDGTTAATVALSDNRISGDLFTDGYTSAVFADKNAGNGRTVTVSGISLSGADAANYTVNTTASAMANISARSLTVTATGINKVYDGTTAATVSLSDNRISGDLFTAAYTSAVFANKNVGIGKTVTVSGISLSGADATNYTMTSTGTATAAITTRPLTVTATGVNKVYDGTTAATVSLSDNRISGDLFTAGYTSAVFATKNVGTGKTVTVSGVTISGTDAANYSANTTTSTTANITARPLTVTATGVNKVYDGTLAAIVTLSDNRISGDAVTDAYTSAVFTNKNVGTGKTVTVSGVSISGTDAANYSANTTTSTTANITARPLTVTATGVNKVYDGTTAATVSLSDDRISGDAVTDAYTSAVFANKNVGVGKAVTVNGISISGADATNYTMTSTGTATADITTRQLTVTAAGVNKVYDGSTNATVSLSDNRVAGDLFTDAYTAAFTSKNVGTGKTVDVTSISISGADAANYSANTSASASADITSKAASVTPNPAAKTYGAADPPFTGALSGFVSGDAVTASYSRVAGETVAGGPYTISAALTPAAALGNYAITYNTANFTITKATASVSANGGNFTYDGAAHGGTGSATGGRGELLPVTLSYAGTGTTVYGPTATAPINAGTYSVVASTSGDSNNIGDTSTPAPLTIGKATATVTLSNLTKNFNGSAQSPTATTTPAGLAVNWTGAPQTNAGSYPVTATINDGNYQGSASGTFVINPATTTATSTLTVANLQPQYSDQDTFTVTVTSSAPGMPAAGVNFFVGSQQVGSPAPVTVPLVAVGDPATSTTYKAVWTGQMLETTPAGQMKPGMHMVTAAFVSPNFTITGPLSKALSIAREDARLAGLSRTSYSLGGSATGIVPLTVTVKDISAMVGDAAFDAFAGDIRNAQVQFIDRATNAVLGTATVNTLIGPGTTTGTATLNWSVNLGTSMSKTYTIGFTVLNYYTRSNFASDNVVVTVSK